MKEFSSNLQAIYKKQDYPEDLRDMRNQIFEKAIIYDTFHFNKSVFVIEELKSYMSIFNSSEFDKFVETIDIIINEAARLISSTSELAAMHNILFRDIIDIGTKIQAILGNQEAKIT